MDDSFSFKNIIIPTAILLDSQLLMGQQPNLVESTVADANYTNTTVVFKQKDADDALVLLSLGQHYGTGSVVRIAVSEPKPQPAEVKAAPHIEAPKAVAEPKMAPRGESVSDETPAPVAARPAMPADVSEKIMVEKRPETSAAAEKALAEKRANGLRSPAPKPVKPTGHIYDPQKRSLLERLPKVHMPEINLGSWVRCPKF